ncbi:DUF1553 domain-containing protein [Neorhodopirellula pilleata]|nr:DUF1553 domain-containing protein [Neorhodopirellula pilleata]
MSGPVFADIDFNRDVRPILSDRCFKCHGPDSSNQDSDFRLDSFENATTDLGGYAGVVPGDLDASVLHARIHDADDPMPPADDLKKLSEADKAILDEWIASGAKFESHWAFEPLPQEVPVPDAGQGWAEGPIDRFIAARLAVAGLSPNDATTKEKWLRRVTFDLTGLPPTADEIRSYLEDESPLARQKVVDRLLDTNACAERLTSEWLDVARYSDTYGYQRDDERYVWPYRDWVIDAFRQNMPYDQFILWQLAGDLLPNATTQQRLATTFNRLHSHKKEGGVDVEEFRVENVADRVHTVGAAFMGLTMECCRCHDHKFDPLTQKDYYGLSAFFDNVDEYGLISFFTSAVPTPAMPLPTAKQQSDWDEAREALRLVDEECSADRAGACVERFNQWLAQGASIQPEKDEPIAGLLAHLPLDSLDPVTAKEIHDDSGAKQKPEMMRSLSNLAGEPAITSDANRIAEGRFGQAVELSGDDAVFLPGLGHYERHDAFSISFWAWSASADQRSVLVRRSRGWGDAGSVGYEITQDNGVLMARMCHFWPGDAIAIETDQTIPTKTWTHITLTYDGSSTAAGLRLFLNGELAKTRIDKDHLTRSISNWNAGYKDLAIGSRYRDRGFAGGRVDEFRLYDRQLSAVEVAHLHDGVALTVLLSKPAEQFGIAGTVSGGDFQSPSPETATESRRHVDLAIRSEDEQRLFEYFVLAVDPESAQLRARRKAARVRLNGVLDSMTSIMVMRETPTPRQTFVLQRGVYDQRGEPVGPQTPAFLPPMPDELPRNRLGLARWLIQSNHPLTARVSVNRYWQMMFGNGLVRTPEDFGNQSEVPTHPELLDWLARDFVASGWDVRRLLRQMALSATYAQSTIVDAPARNRDPENRFYSRGTDRRLTAEMIRDNALMTSGLLVDQVGGRPVKPYDVALAYNPLPVDQGDKLYRRSLYTFWKRTSPAPIMTTLNASTREVCRLKREITNTPLQALVLLNSPQFIETSRMMAVNLIERFGEDKDRIVDEAFLRLTSRRPREEEHRILLNLYDEQVGEFQADGDATSEFLKVGQAPVPAEISPPRLAAATVLIQSIMNLDECLRHQ